MLLNNIISSCITNSLNTNVRRYILCYSPWSTALNGNSTENGVYTAQYREYIKMVKEIGGKTNNNTNWCEWKIIAPKSEQIFRKLHGWTRESNFARPPARKHMFARSFPLSLCSSSSLLAKVSKTHITRYYFCLSGITFLSFFSVARSLVLPSPSICAIAIVFSRKLFSIRFMAFTIAVSPRNLCVPTFLCKSKLMQRMPSFVAIETVVNFKGHFNQWTSFKHRSILFFERMSVTHTRSSLFYCGCDLFSATFRNQTFYDPCLLMPSFTFTLCVCDVCAYFILNASI